MLNSTLKLVAVFAASLVLGFSLGRADDFKWNKAEGDPTPLIAYACEGAPDCVTSDFCSDLNPPVTMIPDNNSGSVVVKSFRLIGNITYGNCITATEADSCSEYPDYGVECAWVYIYAKTSCSSLWGTKHVYAGTCSSH